MPLVDDLRRALTPDPRVVAAWLFGSRARGDHRPDSDVDVAVLLDAPPTGFDDYPWELEPAVSEATGLTAQIVVVNRAPADLVRRVLRDGVLVLDRDPPRRVRFQVNKHHEYVDRTPHWVAARRLPPGMLP